MVTFTQPDADDFADDSETWQPKKGSPESILGTIVERKTVTREDGTEVELFKLETGTGKTAKTWTIWASPTNLKKLVKRDDPQPGDTWGVEYQGSKPIGQGRSVDLYGAYHKAAGAKSARKLDISNGPADTAFEAEDDEPF